MITRRFATAACYQRPGISTGASFSTLKDDATATKGEHRATSPARHRHTGRAAKIACPVPNRGPVSFPRPSGLDVTVTHQAVRVGDLPDKRNTERAGGKPADAQRRRRGNATHRRIHLVARLLRITDPSGVLATRSVAARDSGFPGQSDSAYAANGPSRSAESPRSESDDRTRQRRVARWSHQGGERRSDVDEAHRRHADGPGLPRHLRDR
uniref:Uncharacterized protein n=1 Tax=Rhodopseudomonas palustris (strain DX-1) TaxID=652103 RepID=E6VF68_RHOPX